jgi:ATP-dependent helicase/nuclease subunit A
VNKPLTIPREVVGKQIEASNPRVSAWVAANAGSGKTRVLAQRVIRLLLDGCDPTRILCLTFTKAAAANMAKRVFDILARWTALDDAALGDALRRIGVSAVDAGMRAHARRLFAAALDTPGGLKVQTIHAFCTRLLHQFPFEANVAARFTVLEERAEAELIDKLRLEVLLQAAAAPDGPLGRALATAITAAADQTFAAVVREAIGQRDVLMKWVDLVGGVEAAIAGLAGALGIASDDTRERVNAEIVDGPNLPSARWAAIAATLRAGSAADQRQAACLAEAMTTQGDERVRTYLKFFFTGSGEPRKSLLTRALEVANPELAAEFCAERERLCDLVQRRRAVVTRDRTAALVTIAAEVIYRYRAEKERRGLLDYDDLVDKTLAMLVTVNPSWVHYKLDRGIDHVLIDEAQDTSPKQWEVVQRLVSEFTAGAGARDGVHRSIFAVGDEKQSIFSFQGAAPHYFAEMKRHFETAYTDSGFRFVGVDFKYSFRSAPVVLDAVDKVFARPEAYRGLTADPVQTVHQAVRDNAPGIVEVWPLVEPDEKREIEGWDAPFDTPSETSPVIRLARTVATRARGWIGQDCIADLATGQSRPVRAGDILVLVRQRGALFEALIRAFKNAGIAVAGADRLMLTEHIAVMDLMVLADALLLPSDDLALATLLKSPLFGFDDDDLFELAWNRTTSLRACLAAKAETNPAFAGAAATFERWASVARHATPFAFYAQVLGPDGGRARTVERLGTEAVDALDEFLSLALDYEARETPSLQGFVAWLRATTSEVKRDMEIARDEVRVMTVHGAKGLEAPIVILADTTTNPAGPYPPRLLKLAPDAAAPWAPERLVWVGARETDVPPVAEARGAALRAAEDEYRRLLYVAMTRAADRLIVCGSIGQRQRPEGCWYDLVRDALEASAVPTAMEAGESPVLRLQQGRAEAAQLALSFAQPGAFEAPDWLMRPVQAETVPAPITPSGAIGAPSATTAGGTDRLRAVARGRLVHRLMQSLPDIPADRRATAARQYLDRAANVFSAADRPAIAAEVLVLLDDPRFAALAGAGSRAEVPIVGRIDRGAKPPLLVSGQLDRLAVTDAAVVIADYKTNHPAPRRLEDVPDSYIGQLALYRAVLARLYPQRAIRALLVWTDIPDFMEISGPDLDAALARVTRQ